MTAELYLTKTEKWLAKRFAKLEKKLVHQDDVLKYEQAKRDNISKEMSFIYNAINSQNCKEAKNGKD